MCGFRCSLCALLACFKATNICGSSFFFGVTSSSYACVSSRTSTFNLSQSHLQSVNYVLNGSDFFFNCVLAYLDTGNRFGQRVEPLYVLVNFEDCEFVCQFIKLFAKFIDMATKLFASVAASSVLRFYFHGRHLVSR